MKPLFLILCAVLGFAGKARAGLTLISRETFQGLGTLTSATPGNLGTVTGNFYKRPGGPRLAGDTTANAYGWSADLQDGIGGAYPGGTRHQWNVDGATPGMVCAWVWIGPINSDSAGRRMDVLRLYAGGNTAFTVSLFGDGHLGSYCDFTDLTGNGSFTPAPNSWVWIAAAWDGATGYQGYYRLPGGAVTPFTFWNAGVQATAAVDGFTGASSQMNPRARYGMPSLYTMSSYADVASPADVVDPPTTGLDWYVNPATGNDGNDGTTAATAWASVAKINLESSYAGMFHHASYLTGDTLHLDCSGAPLVVGVWTLEIKTAGLTVLQTGGAIEPMTTLAPAGWSLVSGTANTYQSTDGNATDLSSVVIFEDGKYLNHPTGANYAAVAAALDRTPGSFYSDDTTLYLHPFDDTNPAADGKTYRRTRNRGVSGSPNSGTAAVLVEAANVHYDGLVCAGTTMARKTDDDPIGSYCFQWDQGAGGTNLLSNFSVDHFSKHGVGRTCGGSNGSFTRQDGVYGQATPYAGFGGTTADVDFSGDATSAGNTWTYLRCRQGNNVGVIGSTTGRADPSVFFYTTHASGPAFSLGQFLGCQTPGGLTEQGVTGAVYLRDTTCGQTGFSCPLTAEECQTTAGVFTTATGQMTLRNCLMTITAVPTDVQFAPAGGSIDVQGCTIDLRGNALGPYATTAVWSRASGSDARTIRIRNTALLMDADKNFTLLRALAATGDTLDVDENLYQLGANGYLIVDAAGTPSTFAQWQSTSGQDLHSTLAANAGLDASARPVYDSPAIDAGSDLGPLTDLDDQQVFPSRKTIGAYEFKPTYALWQAGRYPAPAQLSDPAISGPAADPDGNGMTNLEEYALGVDPAASATAALAALPTLGVGDENGLTFLTLTYPRLNDAPGLSYTPQYSTDLNTWVGGDGALQQVSSVDVGGGVSLVTVRTPDLSPATPREFLRLRIQLTGH